jgi:DNA replication protein DnaC
MTTIFRRIKMAYPAEIHQKAERILEQRRQNSAIEAEARAQEIKQKLPEINEIQGKLSRVGLEISKLFFYKGNSEEKVAELKAKSKELVAQRSAILVKNGFSENAMQQEHICPVCEDKGFINGRLCACHKQLLKDIMRDKLLKLAPLEHCTFDNFDLDNYKSEPLENSVNPRVRAQRIFDASRRYAQNFSLNSKNLIFLGKTGLGKTHLSLAIANVVINKGYYVCYGTSQNICEDLRAEMFGRDSKLTYTLEDTLGCDLLIIDDLGTEIDNQYNIASLYNIINSRILSGRPTIISTNYDFNELLAKYDQRITSRISGEYTQLQLFGEDIRIKSKNKNENK